MALYIKNSNNELELYDSPWAAEELYPVGFVYVQFPNTDDPATLGLPGTWQNISSNWAGRFFRAEGGQAAAFGCCQDYATNYCCIYTTVTATSSGITHCHTACINCSVKGVGVGGTISSRVLCNTSTSATTSNGAHTHTIVFSNTIETRPDNYTVRIWKRVA